MRVALLGDVHGNAVALDAVLSRLAREEPDQVVCLGDIVATGPQPVAALERIRQLDCPVVMGNTDEWVLDPDVDEKAAEPVGRIQEIDVWCADQLSRSHRRYVESFEETVTVELDDTRMLCYHGSPQSHSDRIEATTPRGDLERAFDGTAADVLVGGHTHVQLFRRFEDAIVLNPGSVGLPHEHTPEGEVRNPPRAEWAMVSTSNGAVSVELRRTPVERNAIVEAASRSEMPHSEFWKEGWSA